MAKDNDNKPNDNPFAAIKLGNSEGERTQYEDFGNYLFGDAYSDDPFADSDPGKQPWVSTMRGRTTIRLFSRGIMGAGAYTLGQYWTAKQMPGYARNLTLRELGTGLNKAGEVEFAPFKYPLRYIARSCDVVFGKPIKAIARMTISDKAALKVADEVAARRGLTFANEADAITQIKDIVSDDAIWFRKKKYFGPEGTTNFKAGKQTAFGRSLGDEMVGITFDFAMASIGDAWGRNIAQILDPNVQKPWRDKDGHVDFRHFTKAVAKSAWQILSKNQGEDWAAALPYVYQCRFQRQALNNAYKGFKLTSDMQQNGGAVSVDTQGKVIDSYAKAGALDLQLRFTGYNWYTLMFREMYDNIANGLRIWKNASYRIPQVSLKHDPFTSAVHGVGFTARYTAKSAIKAFIYMTPATPFFWVFRTPQTKPWGIAIHASDQRGTGGAITNAPVGRHLPDVELSGHTHKIIDSYNNPLPAGGTAYLRESPLPSEGFTLRDPRNVFDRSRTKGVLDTALNPFGRFSYDLGKGLFDQVVDPVAKRVSSSYAQEAAAHITPRGFEGNSVMELSNAQRLARKHTHVFANASTAYTPYMIAKAETALKWNNPNMDKAIYRFLDGVTSFKVGEVKGGLADMKENIIHPVRHGTPIENKAVDGDDLEPEKTPEPKVEAQSAKSEKMDKKPREASNDTMQSNVAWASKEHGKKQAMQDLLDGQVTIH